MTGQDLVDEARSWLGTPFRKCVPVKGLGCDCAGLLLACAQAVGLSDGAMPRYSQPVHPEQVFAYLQQHLEHVCGEAYAGDVVLLQFSGQAIHLGLTTAEGTLIHSWERAGCVVEHAYDAFWQEHTAAVYRWRGLY
jgi:cell wall-associated NlpC family hydrolase